LKESISFIVTLYLSRIFIVHHATSGRTNSHHAMSEFYKFRAKDILRQKWECIVNKLWDHNSKDLSLLT